MTRTTRLANLLTPAGGIGAVIALVAVIGLVIAAATGLGFRFDPFDRAERRAAQAEATAVLATSNASARAIETAGARATTRAVERTAERIRAADTVANHHQQLAREAPDATELVDPDRRDRLLGADQCLCRLAPHLCTGSGAAPRHAGDGDEVLCPAPSGPRSDPG